jgi:predicted nucleic acid-binding protein
VTDDPADAMFLATALAARVRTIVSGDKHLLRISGWRDIIVCTPRQFHDKHLLVAG